MSVASLENKSLTIFRLLDSEEKKYTVPSFQRGYVWSEGNALDLLDSIYTGIPIGQLISWEQPDGSSEIVDGQQRFNTLLGIKNDSLFINDYKCTIVFNYKEEKFSVVRTAQYSSSKIPVKDIWKIGTSLNDVAKESDLKDLERKYGKRHALYYLRRQFEKYGNTNEELNGWLNNIKKVFKMYNNANVISINYIGVDVPLTQVVKIFSRVNKSGRPLKLMESSKVPLLTLVYPSIKNDVDSILEDNRMFNDLPLWKDKLDKGLIYEMVFELIKADFKEEMSQVQITMQKSTDGESFQKALDNLQAKCSQINLRDYVEVTCEGYYIAASVLSEKLHINSPALLSHGNAILKVLIAAFAREAQRNIIHYGGKQRELPNTPFPYSRKNAIDYYLLVIGSDRYIKYNNATNDLNRLISKDTTLLELARELKVQGNYFITRERLAETKFAQDGRGRAGSLLKLLGSMEAGLGAYTGEKGDNSKLDISKAQRHHIIPASKIGQLAEEITKKQDDADNNDINFPTADDLINNICNITWVSEKANSWYSNSMPREYLRPRGSKYIGDEEASNFFRTRAMHEDFIKTLITEPDDRLRIYDFLIARENYLLKNFNDFITNKLSI